MTFQASADVDGGQGEAGVGEDKGPPVEMEPELAPGGDATDDAEAEEPERKAPHEHGDHEGQHLHDLRGDGVRAEIVVAGGGRVVPGQLDDGEGRETGGADGDEHGGAARGRRQPVHDHAAHVAGVHAHGHEHPETLGRQPSKEHRHGVLGRLGGDAGAGDGAAQHEGEHGQIPGRGHVLDAQARVGEEDEVGAHGDHVGGGKVRPEEDAVGGDEPRSAGRDGVVRQAGDDARQAEEGCAEEERLCGMGQTGF